MAEGLTLQPILSRMIGGEDLEDLVLWLMSRDGGTYHPSLIDLYGLAKRGGRTRWRLEPKNRDEALYFKLKWG